VRTLGPVRQPTTWRSTSLPASVADLEQVGGPDQ
jgi:hypothetical protein